MIDDLVASVGRQEKVIAYRAGAFSAQPGHRLLPALAANGIVIDSSVVAGMKRTLGNHTLDYRAAPAARRHWRVQDDVSREAPQGIVSELPIYSRMGRRFSQITWRRMRAKFSKNVPKEKQKELMGQLGVRRNPAKFLQFLFEPVPIKLDFHNQSAGQMTRWVRSAPPPPEGDLDVLI